jgi:hypothetical protein
MCTISLRISIHDLHTKNSMWLLQNTSKESLKYFFPVFLEQQDYSNIPPNNWKKQGLFYNYTNPGVKAKFAGKKKTTKKQTEI